MKCSGFAASASGFNCRIIIECTCKASWLVSANEAFAYGSPVGARTTHPGGSCGCGQCLLLNAVAAS
eukprot:1294506-Pleurochrysis_carterae.AAC.1